MKLKALSFREDFTFRCACRGVGTFRVESYEEELRIVREVFEEVCEAHGVKPTPVYLSQALEGGAE